MPRDIYYLGVIVVMIGFNMALLEFYTQPKDCSKTAEISHMVGYTKGVRNTTALFTVSP